MSAIRNHADCAHVWASQNRDSGKSGPLYFEGRTIYSYGRHYPIATFTDARDANGERIVLWNAAGSTMTTSSKHKPAVSRALHGLPVRVIAVSEVCDNPAAHLANLADLVARHAAAVLAVARAKGNAEWRIVEADKLAADAADYARAFNLPAPELPELTPETLAAARERAKEASKANAAKTRERNAAIAERARLDALAYEEKAALWRAGVAVNLPWNRDAVTMLRLIDEGRNIETSRGAVVPVAVAAGLWRAACACRRKGEGAASVSTSPGSGFAAVGDYTLREIRADGSLVIGCHVLEFVELERMAAVLGLPAYVGAEVVA